MFWLNRALDFWRAYDSRLFTQATVPSSRFEIDSHHENHSYACQPFSPLQHQHTGERPPLSNSRTLLSSQLRFRQTSSLASAKQLARHLTQPTIPGNSSEHHQLSQGSRKATFTITTPIPPSQPALTSSLPWIHTQHHAHQDSRYEQKKRRT